MLLQLLSIVPFASRLLAQSENPLIEFSITPLTAFWITLLVVIVVGVLILINALASPRQVEGYGLNQAHGDSEHENHH
jgi:uncharacterized protein HemY